MLFKTVYVSLNYFHYLRATVHFSIFVYSMFCCQIFLSLLMMRLLLGESFNHNNNHPFTTKDRDNDAWGTANCAIARHGAWWYNQCTYINLNGPYYSEERVVTSDAAVFWYYWKRQSITLKSTEMKIRPIN